MKEPGIRSFEPRVELKKMKALDFILILVILLGSAGWLLASRSDPQEDHSDTKEVLVYHDGTLTESMALDTDKEISLLQGKMILEVRSSSIRVKHSDCPRQFCVDQGWAKYDGESIICVPFKTLVEIKSSVRPVVDAVVY